MFDQENRPMTEAPRATAGLKAPPLMRPTAVNVLLAIGLPPSSRTEGKIAPPRWPGPPRHAPHPHGELRDRGGELRDRQPLKTGELRERRQSGRQVLNHWRHGEVPG